MLKELPDKNWKKTQKNLLLGIKFLSTNCFVTSHYLRKTLSESYKHSIVNMFFYISLGMLKVNAFSSISDIWS